MSSKYFTSIGKDISVMWVKIEKKRKEKAI
jgi:hypothetical protein